MDALCCRHVTTMNVAVIILYMSYFCHISRGHNASAYPSTVIFVSVLYSSVVAVKAKGRLPPINFGLSENFLLVGKFTSKNAKFRAA